jgi:hypothetical protein
MFGLKRKEVEVINAAAPAMRTPSFAPAKRTVESGLSEYDALAREIGLKVPHVAVEGFVEALERLQYPIYNLAEVVAFMDEKAKTDGKGFGWEWRPVRNKDHINNAAWGTPSSRDEFWALTRDRVTPASDYYNGPSEFMSSRRRTPHVYDKVIPMHALQRIAAVEKTYSKPVSFFVSDYATEPHIRPDPFLLVVLRDTPVELGRFVIDFWDEPNFGIDKMLK